MRRTICIVIACIMLVVPVVADDATWWGNVKTATNQIRYHALIAVTGDGYEVYDAIMDIRDIATAHLNLSQSTNVSPALADAKQCYESYLNEIILGTMCSESMFYATELRELRSYDTCAESHYNNASIRLILLKGMYDETTLQDQIERQPSDRPTNSSATV